MTTAELAAATKDLDQDFAFEKGKPLSAEGERLHAAARKHRRQVEGRAGTRYSKCMQYTLRDIPREVDQALRKKAKAEKKSLNQAAIEALRTALCACEQPVKRRDLSDLAGTWVEDPEFDRIMAEQDQIDPELWK